MSGQSSFLNRYSAGQSEISSYMNGPTHNVKVGGEKVQLPEPIKISNSIQGTLFSFHVCVTSLENQRFPPNIR